MTPEEKAAIEAGLRYNYFKVLALQMELESLNIEIKGLLDIAGKLGEHTVKRLLPAATADLKYELFYHKHLELSSRYGALANGLHETFTNKAKEAKNCLNEIDRYFSDLGRNSNNFAGRDVNDENLMDDLAEAFNDVINSNELIN
jgi:hypothetical protein